MKDISIRKTWVLMVLAAIAAGLMIVVEFTKIERKDLHYEVKLKAAQQTEKCLKTLKDDFFGDEITIDNINDPNDTRIIGSQFSEITSGRGSLPVKLSTTNPNFAAMVVQLILDAGLKSGDHIAVCATGSFPALNIATVAAAEALGLEVSLITSTTSSSWGANNPNFTYVDMQQYLFAKSLMNTYILAGSIGANNDIGKTLSPEGRRLAKEAILRNDIPFLAGENLQENIDLRMHYFSRQEKALDKPIKLYINVGGGVASLGSSENADQLPSGLVQELKLAQFPDKRGVVFEMAAKRTPVINLLHLSRLMERYDLPIDPSPIPSPGEGKLYQALRYDLAWVFASLASLVLLFGAVLWIENKNNKLGQHLVNHE